MMKQIVIVVGVGDYTGAAKMAHLYGRSFREAGWSVVFITGDRPQGGARLLVDVLKKDSFSFVEEIGFFRLRDSSLIRRVGRLIEEIAPQLVASTVQLDLKIVGPAARKAGCPYIVFDQTLHRFFGIPPVRWVKRLAFAREMQQAARIIAVSEAVCGQAIKEFACKAGHVAVLPNGIETGIFLKLISEPVNLPPRVNGACRILNVGRLDPQKGQKILVKAATKCIQSGVHCELLLVGDVTVGHPESEKYAKEIRELVKQLAIKKYVHFLGWRNDIVALHHASDIYVHSAFWEGSPLAVFEAMAAGKPIIVTEGSAVPSDFLDKVHGFIVKTGDANALSSALQRMIKLSPNERAEMGMHAQRLVQEKYDVKVTGKRFVQLCEEAVGL